ncbi:hypothetical protein O181_019445 [Austropuccinia psidii MF-1]|uniref:Uncharacterized protein n=1 Tax=Austropuccinia psidii MF-1 TaxID=1389203 RepID=A0A9Q3CBT7_9BASI|nr:hypothetical protein [Austropuccinia psidii MF-1]
MTICVENDQHPLMIDNGAHFPIAAKQYSQKNSPIGKSRSFQLRKRNFKSASEKMTSIGTIIKEIIIPYRKGDIRLNLEFVVLEDAHIQGFLLGKDS